MKYVGLVIVFIAWLYSLYISEKANPSNSNDYILAWTILSIFWGVVALALISA